MHYQQPLHQPHYAHPGHAYADYPGDPYRPRRSRLRRFIKIALLTVLIGGLLLAALVGYAAYRLVTSDTASKLAGSVVATTEAVVAGGSQSAPSQTAPPPAGIASGAPVQPQPLASGAPVDQAAAPPPVQAPEKPEGSGFGTGEAMIAAAAAIVVAMIAADD